MDNNKNINRQCMEKILSHLTKLICLTEFGNSKELSKYVDMSTSVSAQLIAIDEQENNNVIEIKGENRVDFNIRNNETELEYILRSIQEQAKSP